MTDEYFKKRSSPEVKVKEGNKLDHRRDRKDRDRRNIQVTYRVIEKRCWMKKSNSSKHRRYYKNVKVNIVLSLLR